MAKKTDMKKASKPKQLKNRKRKRQKQLIVKSALKLFSRHPFYKVGIRDIAKEARVSIGCVYRYFPNKEELFSEALFQEIDTATRAFLNLLKQSEPASLKEITALYVNHILDHEDTLKALVHPIFKGYTTSLAKGRLELTAAVFFDKIAAVFISCGFRKDTHLYAQSFISSINGIILTFRNSSVKNKAEIRAHIIELTQKTAEIYAEQNELDGESPPVELFQAFGTPPIIRPSINGEEAIGRYYVT